VSLLCQLHRVWCCLHDKAHVGSCCCQCRPLTCLPGSHAPSLLCVCSRQCTLGPLRSFPVAPAPAADNKQGKQEEAPRECAPTHTTVKMGAASRLQAFADEDEDEDEPLNLAQVSLVSCPPSRVRALDSDCAAASVVQGPARPSMPRASCLVVRLPSCGPGVIRD
jgi:hypothetical protein